MTLQLFLQVLALVLLLLAGLNFNPRPRVHFGWFGLFCWLLSEVLGGGGGAHFLR
jgi:hypothetical protein